MWKKTSDKHKPKQKQTKKNGILLVLSQGIIETCFTFLALIIAKEFVELKMN
jgi:hypothetical protein